LNSFSGLIIFILCSLRIVLHDISPPLQDLHLNKFADILVFIGTETLILDPDKALSALEVPKLVKQGKVALFLEGLNHRVQITLANGA